MGVYPSKARWWGLSNALQWVCILPRPGSGAWAVGCVCHTKALRCSLGSALQLVFGLQRPCGGVAIEPRH